MHDRRAAVVADLVLADRVEDRLGFHPPQADVGAGDGGDGPREAPAVAVEHRQRPQVDRMPGQVPAEDVVHRIEVGAAVVDHHALRVAGRARGVVEADRVPFVLGQPRRMRGIALREPGLVLDLAEALAGRRRGAGRPRRPRTAAACAGRAHLRQRLLHHRRELACR